MLGKNRASPGGSRGKRSVYYIAAELDMDTLYCEFSKSVGEEIGIYVPPDAVAAL